MIAVMRMDGSNTSSGLTDENGETTSHLQGLFYRTIRMLSHGIKPCYVFDGKPPELKSGEVNGKKLFSSNSWLNEKNEERKLKKNVKKLKRQETKRLSLVLPKYVSNLNCNR